MAAPDALGGGPVAFWQRRPRPFRWVKRFLPRTLFGRSLMIMVTPVVLAQLIATYWFYDRHWEELTKRLAFGVAGEIAMVIEELKDDDGEAARAATLARTASTMDLYITWLPGEMLPDKPQRVSGILETTLARALDERVRRPWRIDTNVAREWIEIRVQLEDGLLSVMSPERRLFSFTSYLFIIWMVGSSAILFAIAVIFMRNQIRPIRRLAVAADAFGKGRDAQGFKPEGAAEVRQAAAAFLQMRARIQRQITQRTEMLAGVSHDLRTPLTRMRLQLAMLPDSQEVEELKADVVEMETMIEGYLAFARGEGTEATQQVQLDRLLREIAGNVRREGADVELDIAGAEVPDLALRANAMKRCLTNLIANGLRYGKRVRIRLMVQPEMIEVVIEDDGPGIPAARREEVFRPFHRLEPSRNQATGGVGLGLTIARDIARSHGGDVVLGDSAFGGLKAVVRLPL